MIKLASNSSLNDMAAALRTDEEDMAFIIMKLSQGIDSLTPHPTLGSVSDDDEEYYDILVELRDFLTDVSNAKTKKKLLSVIEEFIGNVSWDNWKQDNPDPTDDGYYTLGSVWFNKLTWVYEGCSDSMCEEVAILLADPIKPYLDYLESLTK